MDNRTFYYVNQFLTQISLSDTLVHNFLSTFRLLVHYNADTSTKDRAEKTAVDWAREAGHDNIVQYLQNPKTAESRSPLNNFLKHSLYIG